MASDDREQTCSRTLSGKGRRSGAEAACEGGVAQDCVNEAPSHRLR